MRPYRRRLWCLPIILAMALGGCGGGGDVGGSDVVCVDYALAPQEYVRSLPSEAGYLTTFSSPGYIYSYTLLTIESECLGGDCLGAVIGPECTAIASMFVGARVQVKLEGGTQAQCPFKLLASSPPKDAVVRVRFTGTEHNCVDWSMPS